MYKVELAILRVAKFWILKHFKQILRKKNKFFKLTRILFSFRLIREDQREFGIIEKKVFFSGIFRESGA